MKTEAVVAPRATSAPAPAPWTPAVLARALTVLLGRPVSAEPLREKAVGLGLLRQPRGDGRTALTLRAAARLLLAYRLPAAVENGTLNSVRDHWQAGRWTFIVLAAAEPELFQVVDVQGELVGIMPVPVDAAQVWPRERFTDAWSAVGNALLTAARSWDELAIEGRQFFGGQRDTDGAFRWNAAECDTDGQGRILRF